MTRIWRNFRERRTALAIVSAVLAFLLSVLRLRAFAGNFVAGVVGIPLIASAAGAIALLAGAVTALRRGNLVFLLVAWAFLLGQDFVAVLRFLDEITAARIGIRFLLAVLSVNLDYAILLSGTATAIISAAAGRRARSR
ncbi:MAG: hypothetical protein JOZ55_09365 [Alphaproteobacteria bacterium]|nr:hypothetical protein [Alphaproteobacteria bacterium]